MPQRRCDPANTVRELAKVARGELAIFQEIEQKGIHVRAHRFHGIECEGISIALISVEHTQRRIAAMCEQREARF